MKRFTAGLRRARWSTHLPSPILLSTRLHSQVLTSGTWPFAALFFIAVLVRIPHVMVPHTNGGDAADYLRLAAEIQKHARYVSEDGSPTAFRPPAYPFYIAVLQPRWALWGQAILGGLSCILVVLMGRSLALAGPGPWLAGLMLAIDPVSSAAAGRYLSETLFQPLFLASILLLLGRGWLTACLAGVLGGLAVLTRGAAVPMLAAAIVVTGFRDPRRALHYAGAIAVTVLPWLARNHAVMGTPTLSTQGGITLYSSYSPPGGKILGVLVRDPVVMAARQAGEAEADRILTRAAIQKAAATPAETVRLIALKLAFLSVPVDWEVRDPPGRFTPVFAFSLPLGAIGLWVHRRRLSLPIAVLIALCLLAATVYGSPRLRLPFEPLLFLAAGQLLASRPPWRHLIVAWAAFCLGLTVSGDLPLRVLRDTARLLHLW